MRKALLLMGITAALTGKAQWDGPSTFNTATWRSGNVGIGYNSNPLQSSLLDLNAVSGTGLNIFKGPHVGHAMTIHDNTGGRFAIWQDGTMLIGSTSTGTAKLNLNMSTIAGNGTALDVNRLTGPASTQFRVYDNGATVIGNQNNLSSMINYPGVMLAIDAKNANVNGISMEVNNATGYALAVHNVNLTAANTGPGVFGLWNDGRMTLGYTGAPNISRLNVNVPSAAQSAIEVYNTGSSAMNFQVKGDGRTYCRELTVTQLALPFPDYVFDKEYKLRTLCELDQYIQKNKKLPGFESAVYYEQNGMSTADMLIRHQEKIEELTLYIIELEKRLAKAEGSAKDKN